MANEPFARFGSQPIGDYPTVADLEAAIAAATLGAAYKSAALVLRSTYAAGVTVNPDGFVPFGITELNDANGILGLDVSNGVANAAIKNLTNGYVLIDFAVTGVLTLNPGDPIPLIDYINDYEANPGNPGNYGYQVGIEAADLTVPRRQILKPGGTLAIVCQPIAMMQVMVKAYTTEQIAIEVATGVARSGFMKINTKHIDKLADPYVSGSTVNYDENTSGVILDQVVIDKSNGLLALGDGIRVIPSRLNQSIDNISGVDLVVEINATYLEVHSDLAVFSDVFAQVFPPTGVSEQIDGVDIFPPSYNLTSGVTFFGTAFPGNGVTTLNSCRLTLPAGGSIQFLGGPVAVMQVMIKATAY